MSNPEERADDREEYQQLEVDFMEDLDLPEIYVEKANIFTELWSWIEKNIYRINVLKGWTQKERTDGEMIALIHAEISEALEGLRHGNQRSKIIPEVSEAEEEIADALIRIMDMAFLRKWNIPKALFLKLEYNKTRPYRHGGKLF